MANSLLVNSLLRGFERARRPLVDLEFVVCVFRQACDAIEGKKSKGMHYSRNGAKREALVHAELIHVAVCKKVHGQIAVEESRAATATGIDANLLANGIDAQQRTSIDVPGHGQLRSRRLSVLCLCELVIQVKKV